MSTVNGSSNSNSTSPANNSASKAFKNIDVDQFLNLMITELQNQDPLNPMDNAQMMQQLSQIREIAATDKLTSTLDSLLVGQNLATASSMIGKTIRATSDGEYMQGRVESVSVEDGPNGARELHVQISGNATAVTSAKEASSKVQLTAKQTGDGWNDVALAFINDNSIQPGQEQAFYDDSDPTQRAVVVKIRDGQTTAANVVAALNSNAAVNQHFQASLVGASTGSGTISIEDSGLTAGGGRQSIDLNDVTDVFPTN